MKLCVTARGDGLTSQRGLLASGGDATTVPGCRVPPISADLSTNLGNLGRISRQCPPPRPCRPCAPFGPQRVAAPTRRRHRARRSPPTPGWSKAVRWASLEAGRFLRKQGLRCKASRKDRVLPPLDGPAGVGPVPAGLIPTRERASPGGFFGPQLGDWTQLRQLT